MTSDTENAPIYWVNKDLIKALLSTELPLSVGELKIPFSRAMFILPSPFNPHSRQTAPGVALFPLFTQWLPSTIHRNI
uniref:Uncharacterized protein n=1 Tax=Gloeothece verrucosa (strain PCC 7822) TaxID=497965 RepID=E0UN78_GLOV7|nr:hypothetical protein Cyan7822_6732 [Gloeothece verrucosa PCC 7822]